MKTAWATFAICAAWLATTTSALATEVLGYTLSTTTRAEFLERNRTASSLQRIPANDDYTKNGYTIDGPPNYRFPRLKRSAFMFDPDDRLCAILLEVPAAEYWIHFSKMKDNYKLLGQENAASGRREALFADGSNRIAFDSSPGNPIMYIMFMNQGFNENNNSRIRARGFRPKFE